jgi:hypothetical protein
MLLRTGDKGTKGSFEYLVYANVLAGVAAQYGLKPVLDYGDPELMAMFDQVRCVVGLLGGYQATRLLMGSTGRRNGMFRAWSVTGRAC